MDYSYAANLMFQTSFEEDNNLLAPDRKESPIWWQDFNHTTIKVQGEEALFQMIVKSSNLHKFMENRIEITEARDGNKTHALHQIIKKKEEEWTQNAYIVDTEGKEQKRLYIRYSLRFPKNLSELLGRDSWLVLSEYKTLTDYRLAFYVYSDEHKKLYWYVHGDNVVIDNTPYKEYWFRENRKVPVPQGEWMEIEIFWERGKHGRVWLNVDGERVLNYEGRTKLLDPIRFIMFFTNYAKTPIDQWIDNIEIWDDYPCDGKKSCY